MGGCGVLYSGQEDEEIDGAATLVLLLLQKQARLKILRSDCRLWEDHGQEIGHYPNAPLALSLSLSRKRRDQESPSSVRVPCLTVPDSR